MTGATLNATLERREDLNQHYAILRIRPDVLPIPAFTPGQFVQVGLIQPARARPGEEATLEPPRMRIAKRSYSIASSALERDHYELFLTLVPGGRLTPDLWKVSPGGRCWIDTTALGAFTLDRVPPARDLVMVATGTGISPYLSMLRTYANIPPWSRFVLVHGVRHESDLGFRGELEARQRSDARFRYLPLVSRTAETPSQGWTGLRGRVQGVLAPERFHELAGIELDPGRCHVFLCGNPEMIQSVRTMLQPRGFSADTVASPGTLHFERYW